MATTQDIRGVLIQVQGGRLLLPNAAIAEVLAFTTPESIGSAPDWLLGRIRWRGWQVPVIAFAQMAGIATESGQLGNKLVVLKALGGDAKLPYFALLTQGFPRLVTVARESLAADAGTGGDDDLPEAVRMRVLLREDQALLPDLQRVESLIGEALQQAA